MLLHCCTAQLYVASQTPNLTFQTANARQINDSTAAMSIPTPETSQSISLSSQSGIKAICRKLYDLFPSQHDSDLIIGSGGTSLFLQFFSLSHSEIFSGNSRPASSLSALPNSSSHPVLLIRTLLYLAIGIQQLHPSNFDFKQLELGSSPWDAMTQYLEAASDFITGNDRYLDSLEALECFMLEGYYHMNTGNLRKAWLLFRRAIGLGQLMGLHRGSTRAVKVLDQQNKANAAFMWYRVVYADRFLALLLGLPASTAQNNAFASEELLNSETPIGRLERVHCVISGRIIERNENMTDDGFAATQSIDSSLQKAAKSMPAKWWLLSNVSSETAVENMEDLMRIIVQIMHFNLHILLHLPYMIRVSPERRFDYSKIACINNSRELLTRYIRLRSFNQVTFCSRSIDFSAFTGCLTLLLAHLDSHRSNNGMDDFLAHQRDSDRVMVEEAVQLLLLDDRPNHDVLAQQTASILKCLLSIEANASGDGTIGAIDAENTDQALRLTIPYFGTVNISRDGIIRTPGTSCSQSLSNSTTVDNATDSPCDLGLAFTRSTAFLKGQDSFISPPTTTAGSECQQTPYQQSDVEQVPWETLPATPSMNLQTEFFPNIQHYPVSLNAEVQDWALQGVDRAFFENLLRGDGL
jgi:Fungal specific transcription factor domain